MAGARYVRYIAFAVLCLVVLFFISSTSTSTSSTSDRIKGYTGHVVDNIKGSYATKPEPPAQPGSKDYPARPPPKSPTTPNEQSKLAPAIAPGPRMNATFVSLARNSDIWEISKSIRHVEDRFNRKFGYDWVFLNDEPFDDDFIRITTALVSGTTKYGLIPKEHWSFPEFIDQDKAAKVRQEMKEAGIIYGDSVSYRHMCRFESGFFYRQKIMMDYEWYWRVEPSIELYCDINYDTFKFMADNNKMYSFVLSLYEYVETIPTMWNSTKKYMEKFPQHIAKDNSMDFISDDGGETYNHCHFWSNFEIGNLNWLRSPAYADYFDILDKDGGFFYERWGDAPVHSIAAALTLHKDQIHFFDDIAYYHVPFTHCPKDEKNRLERKCSCDPEKNFDWNGYSCTNKYFELNGIKKPTGAPLSWRQKRNRIVFGVTVGIILLVMTIVVVVNRTTNTKREPNHGIGAY